MEKKYTIVVEEAGENLSAYCPELPGCIATGKTMEEVIENMKDALVFHVQGLKEEGIEPSHKVWIKELEIAA